MEILRNGLLDTAKEEAQVGDVIVNEKVLVMRGDWDELLKYGITQYFKPLKPPFDHLTQKASTRDIYGEWVVEELSLIEAKTNVYAQINTDRNRVLRDSVIVNTSAGEYSFDSDIESLLRVVGSVLHASVTGTISDPEWRISWITRSAQTVELTSADLIQLGTSMMQKESQFIFLARTYKDQLMLGTTDTTQKVRDIYSAWKLAAGI